jgi:hypothetical protein
MCRDGGIRLGSTRHDIRAVRVTPESEIRVVRALFVWRDVRKECS